MRKQMLVLALSGVAAVLSVGQVMAQEKPKDLVDTAAGSKDHTTLVAAVKAAELVYVLKAPGPLTVFAPTNAAFDKLPKGTVENLLKPENKQQLSKLLQFHVAAATYPLKHIQDGMDLGMANGDHVKFTVKDGKYAINGANVIATVPCSNGLIHVIDGVLSPPAKK